MYLTTIDDNRAIIQCNFVKDKFVKVSALYDTGAQTSIITALSINPSLRESDFEKYEKTSIKGLIDDDELSITGYKIQIQNFYFGNIHIGCVNINIVFDERVTDNVVGMDIISRITRLGIANTDKMYFFKDEIELIEFVNNMEEPILSANYINKQVNRQ